MDGSGRVDTLRLAAFLEHPELATVPERQVVLDTFPFVLATFRQVTVDDFWSFTLAEFMAVYRWLQAAGIVKEVVEGGEQTSDD